MFETELTLERHPVFVHGSCAAVHQAAIKGAQAESPQHLHLKQGFRPQSGQLQTRSLIFHFLALVHLSPLVFSLFLNAWMRLPAGPPTTALSSGVWCLKMSILGS